MEAVKTFSIYHYFKDPKFLIISLFAVLLYGNTLTHDYVWDDIIVITNNQYTKKGLSGLKEIWTGYTYLEDRPIYRPIPQSIHALSWQFFPNNPMIPHAINILCYALCCLSLLILIKRYFPETSSWLLFFIGLLFSLLPVHVEVVANCKSLDELLSALFVVWSLILFKTFRWKQLLFSLLFLVFAVLSKVSALTLLPLYLIVVAKQLGFQFNTQFYFLKRLSLFPIIGFSLIAIAAYLFALDYKQLFCVYLLFISAPFILWTPNKTVKAVLLLFLTIGLSFLGRWEFSLVVFVIYFGENLKNQTLYSKWILLVFTILFLVITSFLGYNGLPPSLFIVVFLIAYYYYQEGNNFIKKYFFHFSAVIIVSLIIIGFFDFFKWRTIYIVLVFVGLTLRNQLALNKKLLVLLLFIPAIELDLFHKQYEGFFGEATETEIILEEEEEITGNILPFHNILITIPTKKERLPTILRVQLIYLKKLVFPQELVHHHGAWQLEIASWKSWDVYLSILFHLLLIILCFFFYRKKQFLIVFGLLWYFFCISIYTNLFVLMPDTLAERFLFLPSFGFSVAFVAFLYYLLQRSKKRPLLLCITLFPLFLYLGYKTIDRSQDWASNYLLAANTIPYAENNAAINAQYAMELQNLVKYNLLENKDSAELLVVKHYKKAVELFDGFYSANSDLAAFYISKAQPNDAFPYLLKAAEIQPEVWSHHYYLGLIYFEKSKYVEAIKEFELLKKNEELVANYLKFPELLEAIEMQARCLHKIGKDEEAYLVLQEGIALYNQKSTYVLLANFYRVTGKTALAIQVFEKLLEIYPNDQELINTITFLKNGAIF